ncbi:MAG TPA: c-type cytochrome [Afifellaceae bacterium]|nr:c-type cytochrome [Afifellaceae bacterium]
MRALAASIFALAAIPLAPIAVADAGHGADADGQMDQMQRMMERHMGHEHEETFEAMKRVPPEQMRMIMRGMAELGLGLPPMDSENGRQLFLAKGCVACHSVNGVGGEMGPAFDAAKMPEPMNSFEFAARMWRGAPAMIELQEQLFGKPVELTGRELADIIAFAHDKEEQLRLSADQIPEQFRTYTNN